MRRQSDAVLHRLLHLLEGAHLDLAHAFTRHAELGRQILERDRVVGKAPRLEDPLARSLSTESASPSAFLRLSDSSSSTSRVS